jgi:hypothetical protein
LQLHINQTTTWYNLKLNNQCFSLKKMAPQEEDGENIWKIFLLLHNGTKYVTVN